MREFKTLNSRSLQKSIIFKIIFLVFEKTPCGGLRGKRV